MSLRSYMLQYFSITINIIYKKANRQKKGRTRIVPIFRPSLQLYILSNLFYLIISRNVQRIFYIKIFLKINIFEYFNKFFVSNASYAHINSKSKSR